MSEPSAPGEGELQCGSARLMHPRGRSPASATRRVPGALETVTVATWAAAAARVLGLRSEVCGGQTPDDADNISLREHVGAVEVA